MARCLARPSPALSVVRIGWPAPRDNAKSFTHESAVPDDICLCGSLHDLLAQVHGATVFVVRVIIEELECTILNRVGGEEPKGLGPIFLSDNLWRPGGQRNQERL